MFSYVSGLSQLRVTFYLAGHTDTRFVAQNSDGTISLAFWKLETSNITCIYIYIMDSMFLFLCSYINIISVSIYIYYDTSYNIMRRSSMDLILLNSGIVAYKWVCVWRVCLFQLGEVNLVGTLFPTWGTNDLGCVCIDGFRPNMDHPWQ